MPLNSASALSDVLDKYPTLMSTPSLAMSAAQSNNPDETGAVGAYATQGVAAANASNDQGQDGGGSDDGGWLDNLGKAVTDPLKHIGQALQAPIHEIQNDYRFIHEEYAKKGIGAGLLATLGVGGAAVAGTLVAGPLGGVAAADAAAAIERGTALTGALGQGQQQLAQTAGDPNTKISFGRDIASGLGQLPGLHTLKNTDTPGFGQDLSGLADVGFDVGLDPLLVGGKMHSAIKEGSLLTSADPENYTKLQSFLNDHAPGLRIQGDPENIQKMYDAPAIVPGASGFRREADRIAGMDAGEVARAYPGFAGIVPDSVNPATGVVTKGLGNASTGQEVVDVFKNSVLDQDLRNRVINSSLPSRTVVRAALTGVGKKVVDAAGDNTAAEGRNLLLPKPTATGTVAPLIAKPSGQALGQAISQKVRTFANTLPYSISKDTDELSTHVTDLNNNDHLIAMGKSLDFGLSRQGTDRYITRIANAIDPDEKRRIFAEGVVEMLKAKGLTEGDTLYDQATGELNGLNSRLGYPSAVIQRARQAAAGPESEQAYGFGFESGPNVATVAHDSGHETQRALFPYQYGNEVTLPNFKEVQRASRTAIGLVHAGYGALDDTVAKHFTDTFFKPLSLVTAGFGLRVAASEGLAATMRYGPMQMLHASVAGHAAELNYKLENNDSAAQSLLSEAEDHEHSAQAYRAGTQVVPVGDTRSAEDIAADHEAKAEVARKAADNLESGHVISAAAKLVGGVDKLINSQADRDLALKMTIQNQGHIVKGVARAGGMYMPDDIAEAAKAAVQKARATASIHPDTAQHFNGDWDLFARDAEKYPEYWHHTLQQTSQEGSAQLIVQDLIDANARGMSNDELKQYAISREADRLRNPDSVPQPQQSRYQIELQRGDRHKYQSPEEAAAAKVDGLRGLLTGEDGTWHNNLAQKIARGEKPKLGEVKAIDVSAQPKQVQGRISTNYIGPNLPQRVINEGFGRVVEPIINNLSREPMYFNAVKQEYDQLAWARANLGLSDEESLRIAQNRGSMAMLPQIHNTALKSQFSVMARNYLPFYFAQEQAVKRAFYLAAHHPESIQGYNEIEHGLNDPGFVHGSGDQKWLALPVVGQMGRAALAGMQAMGMPAMAGLPVNATGSMASLSTVIPELKMPGASPIVAVPMNALTSMVQQANPKLGESLGNYTKDLLGPAGYQRGVVESLIPNELARNVYVAATGDENNRSFANARAAAIASAYANGQMPDANATPMEKQAFLDRIDNNTRSMFIAKALVGLVSPLSPTVNQDDPGLRDEFQQAVKTKGYTQALSDFVANHGSKSISYTISKTQPNVQGAYQPYTKQFVDWTIANKGLASGDLGTGAAFLAPQGQGKGFDQVAYDQMLKMHLRSQDSPEDFMNAIYVAAGNNELGVAQKAYVNDLKNAGATVLPGQEGKGDFTQVSDLDTRGVHKKDLQAIKDNWNAVQNQLANKNPIWYDDYASPQRKNLATQAYQNLYQIFASGQAPGQANPGEMPDPKTNPQGHDVAMLMMQFQNYQVAKAAVGTSTSKSATKRRNALDDQWQGSLVTVAQQQPELQSVIRSVFSRLPWNTQILEPKDSGTVSQ